MAEQHERAKAAFGRALTRWQELMDRPEFNQRQVGALDPEQAANLLDLGHMTAVEALLWARAFSDAARGCDGIDALRGYPKKIPDLPPEIKAARYAANKGVHLLVELAEVGYVADGPAGWGMGAWGAGLSAPVLRWVVDKSKLPPVMVGKNKLPDRADQDLRDRFAARWCGEPVAAGLSEVEAHLKHWCPD